MRRESSCLHFDGKDLDGLTEKLIEMLRPGDCVLLKGSNSMKLGKVAERLLKDG